MLRADQVAFGIEMDCRLPASHGLPVGDHPAGLHMSAIDHWEAEGWMACTLYQSLAGRTRITSPPLTGEAGLTEVVCMTDWLAEIGAQTDEQCEFRVWVDAQHLSPQTVGQILHAVSLLSAGVLSLVGIAVGRSGRGASSRQQVARLEEATSRPDDRMDTVRRLVFGPFTSSLDSARIVAAILSFVGLVAGVTDGCLPSSVPADARGQLRSIIRNYVLGYRVVPPTPDDPSDLRDVIRYMLTIEPTAV